MREAAALFESAPDMERRSAGGSGGHSLRVDGSADAVRALNNMRHSVSAWRRRADDPGSRIATRGRSSPATGVTARVLRAAGQRKRMRARRSPRTRASSLLLPLPSIPDDADQGCPFPRPPAADRRVAGPRRPACGPLDGSGADGRCDAGQACPSDGAARGARCRVRCVGQRAAPLHERGCGGGGDRHQGGGPDRVAGGGCGPQVAGGMQRASGARRRKP